MTHTLRWAPALLALVAGGTLLAQEAPPPPAPPTTEGVRLAYKWIRGRKSRLAMKLKGEMAVSIEGGPAGAPNQMPITMSGEASMLQHVSTVAKDGTGTVAASLDALKILMDLMGNSMVMRYQNGKFSMSMNGQNMPMPPGGAGAPGMPGMDPKLLRQPFTMRISRLGKILSVKGPASTVMSSFPGTGQTGMGAGGFALQLPDHPLQVGEAWEETQQMNIPIGPPGAGLGRGVSMNMEMRAIHTLRKIIAKGMRRLAVIDTDASISVPESAGAGPISITNMNTNVTGVTYFDIGRGEISSSKHDVNLSLAMGMDPGALGGQGAGGQNASFSLDGSFNVTVTNTPVTAAPAKSAVRRKR
ncbi:MAG: hypothetical protein HY320_09865 [Armatimonadetes bacterium]|nr:hypothetical protein [Armatimonadota bacterium]